MPNTVRDIKERSELTSRDEVRSARACLFSLLRRRLRGDEINEEGLTLAEWTSSANYGVRKDRRISGCIAKLAWCRRHDPTDYAAQGQELSYAGDPTPRPGETQGDGYYVLAVTKSGVERKRREGVARDVFFVRDLTKRIVDIYMPWESPLL